MHRSSPRDNCASGVPFQKHSKPPTEVFRWEAFCVFQGLFLMYIDVYKFLIRIFAIGGRASLLCVYFDALIFKGKSMLRWQEGFYLYKGNWGVCSCRREGIPHLAYFSACLCGILPVGGRLPICFCRAFPCGAEDAIIAVCCRGPRRRRERRGASAARLLMPQGRNL